MLILCRLFLCVPAHGFGAICNKGEAINLKLTLLGACHLTFALSSATATPTTANGEGACINLFHTGQGGGAGEQGKGLRVNKATSHSCQLSWPTELCFMPIPNPLSLPFPPLSLSPFTSHHPDNIFGSLSWD